MLFHLFCWLLIGVPCVLIGLFIETRTCTGRFPSPSEEVIGQLFLGLAVISALSLALSLLGPVSPIALGLILAIGAAITLGDGPSRSRGVHLLASVRNRRSLALLLLFAMLAAFSAADPIKIYDTGAYHYPLVRWLATTGTIPGLALLYKNFGFVSSWFALTAALDHGFLTGRVAGVLNGLVAFTAVLHFGLAGARVLASRALRSDWFLLGAYPVIFAFWYQLNYHTSPSPDLPVLVFLVVIAWRMMVEEELSFPRASLRCNLPLLVLGGGIVNLKLSAAPILAVVLFTVSVRCRWAVRDVLLAAFTGCLFSMPLISANIVASGYPLYPSLAFPVNAAWTVPAEGVTEMANVIKNAAYCNGACAEPVVGWNWVVPWLHNLQNLMMLFVSAAALVTFTICKAWRFGVDTAMVLFLAETGVLYVLLTVPNLRFAIGYLAVCTGLCLAILTAKNAASRHYPLQSNTTLAFGIALIVGLSFLADSFLGAKGQAKRIGVRQLLVPQALPAQTGEVATLKNRHVFRSVSLVLASETTNGVRYYRPLQNELCWAAQLPCVPGGLRSNVVLRNLSQGWKAGFAIALPQNYSKQSRPSTLIAGSVSPTLVRY